MSTGRDAQTSRSNYEIATSTSVHQTASTRRGSSFLTLPTAQSTGQDVMASDGKGAQSALSSAAGAGFSPSQTDQVSGASMTGMRLWTPAKNSFGVVVRMVKVWSRSGPQVSHNPAKAKGALSLSVMKRGRPVSGLS